MTLSVFYVFTLMSDRPPSVAMDTTRITSFWFFQKDSEFTVWIVNCRFWWKCGGLLVSVDEYVWSQMWFCWRISIRLWLEVCQQRHCESRTCGGWRECWSGFLCLFLMAFSVLHDFFFLWCHMIDLTLKLVGLDKSTRHVSVPVSAARVVRGPRLHPYAS